MAARMRCNFHSLWSSKADGTPVALDSPDDIGQERAESRPQRFAIS